MDGIESLQTERLNVARLRAGHLDDLRLLHADPGVMATLSADGEVAPEGHTQESLRSGLEHWERHGYGSWVFHERAGGRFVGYCGLWNDTVEGRHEVELAYAVASGCWGEGFGTEMAEATVALGFERLGLMGLVAYTLPANRASRRVMEKTGFGYERDIVHAGLPHVLYSLTASGWRGVARGDQLKRWES